MARGLVQVAKDLKNIGTDSGGIRPIDVGSRQSFSAEASTSRVSGSVNLDDGAAAGFDGLARSFQQIGDKVGALADRAAQQEGDLEGRHAGMDPEFRTRRDLTIRGEAFDRAGLDIAGSRIKHEVDAALDRAREQAGGNPKAMQASIDAVAKGIMPNVPDELAPGIELYLGSKSLAYMRDATRQQIAEQRQAQAAAVQTELATATRSLHQKAFMLGLDPQSDAVLAAETAQILGLTKRRGMDGKPLVDPVAAGRLKRELELEVTQARLLGAFDRIDGPARKAFIDGLEADWKQGKGAAAVFDLQQMRSIRSQLEGELRHDEARRDVGARTLKQTVTDVAKMAAKGYAPPPEQLAQLEAEVIRSGSPELAQALTTAKATLGWVRGARTMDDAQLEQHIAGEEARLQQRGATPADLAHMEMARGLLKEMRGALKDDPLGWAQRVGYPVKPLDTGSAAGLTLSLRERIQAGDLIAEKYRQEARYLRPAEVRELVAAAAPGGEALTDVVTAIRNGAGPKAEAVLREVFKDAPTLAVVGGLTLATKTGPADAPPSVVKDVADGVHMTRLKEVKNLAPTAFQARQWASGAHQGALAGAPENEQALIDATNYAYNLRLQRARKTEDPALWRKTYRELLGERTIGDATYGGVTQYRGQAIVVPPDVRQDGFAALVAELKPEDFGSDGPRNAKGPATAAQIGQARLESVGNGRYRMNVGDADYPLYLVDANNQPFVLDINAMKPALQQRKPELYIDGGKRPPGMMRLGGPMPDPRGKQVDIEAARKELPDEIVDIFIRGQGLDPRLRKR